MVYLGIMTIAQINALADKYIEKLKKRGLKVGKRSEVPFLPTGVEALAHALWLCHRVRNSASVVDSGPTVNPERAQRMLGFVQGVLWMTGQRTLSQINEDELA